MRYKRTGGISCICPNILFIQFLHRFLPNYDPEVDDTQYQHLVMAPTSPAFILSKNRYSSWCCVFQSIGLGAPAQNAQMPQNDQFYNDSGSKKELE